jgi:pimeloyl-ACP methyl ester carboxylesterase
MHTMEKSFWALCLLITGIFGSKTIFAQSGAGTGTGGGRLTDYLQTPNRFIEVGNTRYAYRVLGHRGGIPLVLLQHYRGSMDYWDPAFIDALAKQRTVITFDNKGVSLSGGETPDSFSAMGDDAADFIAALGYKKVDVLGFSIGGCVAQELTISHPALVRRLILAGTAPKGGQDMNKRNPEVIRLVTKPKIGYDDLLIYFFDTAAISQQLGREFLNRRKQRTGNFDIESNLQTLRAHTKARQDWGQPADTTYAYLRKITQPVLVANGSNDIMMFTINSYILFQHLPDAHLILYPNAGHAFLFQYPEQFAGQVNSFLNQKN